MPLESPTKPSGRTHSAQRQRSDPAMCRDCILLSSRISHIPVRHTERIPEPPLRDDDGAGAAILCVAYHDILAFGRRSGHPLGVRGPFISVHTPTPAHRCISGMGFSLR